MGYDAFVYVERWISTDSSGNAQQADHQPPPSPSPLVLAGRSAQRCAFLSRLYVVSLAYALRIVTYIIPNSSGA